MAQFASIARPAEGTLIARWDEDPHGTLQMTGAEVDYARERRQGGVPIAAHQNVAYRLFHMYRKVEAARALARRAMLYNFTQPVPALHAAMASKITGTQAAFEVASDALQIFCGAGIRRDRPIEKIFRDARLSMIEDGCNEILAIKGGRYLADGNGI